MLIGPVSAVDRVTDSGGTDLRELLDPMSGLGVPFGAGEVLTVDLGAGASAALVVESRGGVGPARTDSVGILVQRRDRSGRWVPVSTIAPRRQFDRQAVAALGSEALRLVFLKEYSLRSLGKLTVTAAVVPMALDLTEATHSRLGTVDAAVDQRGGGDVTIAPGETVTLDFAPTAGGAGLLRDYFLMVRGSVLAPSEVAAASGAILSAAPHAGWVFGLGSASPNPALGATLIAYTLARTGRAELEIYDVVGRRVRSLVRAEQSAGPQEAAWDGLDETGRRVPAGVYFYRLQAGDWQSERKLILLSR